VLAVSRTSAPDAGAPDPRAAAAGAAQDPQDEDTDERVGESAA
jgi:hypothetical protein